MIDRLLIAATAIALALPVSAQTALEENRPETPVGQSGGGLDLGELPETTGADATGFGVTLTGLRLIDAPGEVRASSAAQGIDANALAVLPGLDLAPILQRYIGQPLSQHVLAGLRRDLVQAHRDAGYAFVAVLLPEQEISNGSVQVLINRFRLGETHVTGETRVPAEKVANSLTLTPGALIDTDALTQDLAWANRNPFRNLRVSAEPGDAFGETDLTIRVEESRPYGFYLGLNNYGTEATGEERAFVGLSALIPGTADHTLSYQHTFSEKGILRLEDNSSFDADAGAYNSHDLIYRLPIAPRLEASLRFARIDTREALTAPLISEQRTQIISATLRSPLSQRGGFALEAFGGISAKRAQRELFFAATPVTATEIDVVQLEGGVTGRRVTDTGSMRFEVSLALSPGGLTGRNEDADFAAFSGDPDARADYAILWGSFGKVWTQPQGRRLEASLRAQLASAAVPTTESFSIGGPGSVRGYSSGEASGDRGAVASASWHMPVSVGQGGFGLSVAPFLDLGTVDRIGAGGSETLAGAGISLTGTFSDRGQIVMDFGVPLRDGPTTDGGDPRVNIGLLTRF